MKYIDWPVTNEIWQRFLYLTDQLEDLDPESDEAYALREEVYCLPFHPHPSTYNPDVDLIVPRLTTVH